MNRKKTCSKTMLIITGLLFAGCLAIFRSYLFGDKLLVFTDIGSDTYDQYLMQYQTIINHLRDGDFSFWDFNNGYGINMFSLSLFDPFLILLYLFGYIVGADKIYGILVILQIVRIILAGLALYGFLSCFSLTEHGKAAACCAYGLSGYIIVWGQHYQFATVVISFPLLLMAAEKAFEKRRWWFILAVICAVSCFSSLYMSYMQFLVLGFYILFRNAWDNRLFSRKGILLTLKIYGSMILGICMGLFSLLPSATMILSVSGRVGGQSLLDRFLQTFRLYEFPYYETLLKRFFSSNLQGINTYSGYTNYYEDAGVFLSALSLLAGVQFIRLFVVRNYTKKQRGLLLLAIVLLAFILLVPAGSMIFNGFVYPFSRHTFLCLPFFAWVTADVLSEIPLGHTESSTTADKHGLSSLLLITSAIVITALYLSFQKEYGGNLPYYLASFTITMAVCLLVAGHTRLHYLRTAAYGCLFLALMVSLCADAWVSYNKDRWTLTKTSSEYFNDLYDPSVQEAIETIAEEDSSFYRLEKDYRVGASSSCLNSLAQNYSGVSTYNSTLNANIKDFLSRFWPELMIIDSSHYSFANGYGNSLAAALSHVKYVLSRNSSFDIPGYELYGQCGNIYIYRNTWTGDLGKFYTAVISSSVYETSADSLDSSAVLSDYLICDTLPEYEVDASVLSDYTKQSAASLEEIIRTDSADGSSITLSLPNMETQKSGQTYLLEFDLSISQPAQEIHITAGDNTTLVSAGPSPVHISICVPPDTDTVTITHPALALATADTKTENFLLTLRRDADLTDLSNGIYFEAGETDSTLTGTVDTDSDGILMIPVPFENGWHAYVDGVETEIHQVDYGFSGIVLEKGTHEIRMEFHCPGLLAGSIGSVAGFFLFLSFLGYDIYKSRKNSKTSSLFTTHY